MTLAELNNILKATGYPVAYSHFKDPQTPPYLCYLVAYSSNFIADNRVYQKIDNVQIELYTTKKDLAAEAKVEQVLDDNEIPYQPTETWLESEQLFQRIYEAGVM